MVRLDIFSDPVCPWCHIGKAHLDRALERAGDHPFLIEWHPFQLNPDMPPGGADRAEWLVARFGSRAAVVAAHARIEEEGAKAGARFDFAAMKRLPNTRDAHRLIHWAGIEGRQSAAVSALFRANFVEGRDIGDAAVLAAIAGEIGMDGAVVARLLATDADAEALAAREAHARRMGVRAVPTFIVANAHVVQGAQPADLWDRVIADLRAAGETA